MSKDNNEIAVQPRSEFGNSAARRARKAGLVPAVIYGKGMESKAVYLNAGEWDSIARHHHHLLFLVEDGRKQAVLVKEVQKNQLKNHYLHVDFQAVDAEEAVHTTVTVHAVGDCVGAARGGVLEQLIHEIAVACKPQDLVDEVKIDVSALEIGAKMHVRDLALPAGVTAVADADAVVFTVVAPKQEEAAAEAETAE